MAEDSDPVYFKMNGCYIPKLMYSLSDTEHFEEKFSSFEYRNGDVFVVAFPKAGLNWTLLCLRELYLGKWGVTKIGERTNEPMFDLLLSKEGKVYEGILEDFRKTFLKHAASYTSPRLFRSHLPSHIFPARLVKESGGKIIYVSRNPKDTCTSYYHFMNAFLGEEFQVGWQQLAERDFLEGRVTFGPWLDHVTGWYDLGEADSVLHVTYEEMKCNFKATIQRIADFIERPVTEEDLVRTTKKCTFESMVNTAGESLPFDEGSFKNRNQFFRKGIIGDWKNHFTVAQSESFDRELLPKLNERGINFTYEVA
ncbi:amine sulfotransferase-like [Ptychodera flava]|uniref:amine sulfotransferase-like n=1 Tax=Ptychodera flava TaxID=63121 RepID=UPI00396AA340